MKNATTIIVGFIVLLVGGLLLFNYFQGQGKDAWVCKDGQWVKQGEPKEPMPEGPCEKGERVEDEKPEEEEEEEVVDQANFEKAKQIAEQAAKKAPTYKFDGSDLKYESYQELECENCWEFTFSFTGRQAGHGDREGQMLAQVITPHQIRVNVQGEKVVAVVTDRTYDELKQIFLK